MSIAYFLWALLKSQESTYLSGKSHKWEKYQRTRLQVVEQVQVHLHECTSTESWIQQCITLELYHGYQCLYQ